MLKALNKALAFERMAAQKYEVDDPADDAEGSSGGGGGGGSGGRGGGGSFGDDQGGDGDDDDDDDDDEVFFDEEGNEITGAAAVRLKYTARMNKRKEAELVQRLRQEKEERMKRIDLANGAAGASVLASATGGGAGGTGYVVFRLSASAPVSILFRPPPHTHSHTLPTLSPLPSPTQCPGKPAYFPPTSLPRYHQPRV